MKKILVTGVGGPTPRSFVRAIKWFGGEYKNQFDFIGTDTNPLAYGLYDKELFSKSFVVPRADSSNYWNAINRIIEDNNIDAAVILTEVEVLKWSKNQHKLNKKIKLNLPDYALAKELVNKHHLHAVLNHTGYIPKFYKLDPKDYSYAEIKKAVGETFWVRSTEGSSGLGSLKINNEQVLAQWVSMNGGVSEFIATEYLPGRNMACKLLYFNNKLLASACGERVNYIMAKVAPSGITGNTSFGRLLNEPGLVKISVDTMNLISSKLNTALNGIFTVDFKEDEKGNAKITEINVRHVAFTSSLAAGGANIPLQTLKAMLLEDPATMETIHYTFPENLIFLRDVDSYPIVMKEEDLFAKIS